MTGRSKLLASKEIRFYTKTYKNIFYKNLPSHQYFLTRCGYAIVEKIAMVKRKATEELALPILKKPNVSHDYVYYMAAKKEAKVYKVSPTKIGKRLIYKFFIDFNRIYYPLRCMLDLGSTSFVISPQAAKAYQIPVGKQEIPAKAPDVGGSRITTEGLFTVPLGLSFGNHRTLDSKDHAFEVMKTSSEYDALIPAWYLNKHKAQGITEGKLHFPLCSEACFGHGKIHPEYTITYDKKVALRPDAIHIGAVLFENKDVLRKQPVQYHKWLLLFDPTEAEKLPDNKGCDHKIELKTSEENL